MTFKRKFSRKSSSKKSTRKGSFRKKSFKKRTAKKPVSMQVRRNTVKLARIAKVVDTTTGTHLRRQRFSSTQGSLYGQQGVDFYVSLDLNQVKNSVNNLKYYDPSAPGSLITANGNTGDYQRDFLITRASSELNLQNQGYVPQTVRVYECRPRLDTQLDPVQCWADGLADQQHGTLPLDTVAQPLTRPSDVVFFNTMWSTSNFKEVRLLPGQKHTFTTSHKPFTFDPSFTDIHSTLYQRKYQAMGWMVVLVGDVAFDSTLVSVSESNTANLLVSRTEVLEVQYDAGVNVQTLEYNQTSSNSGLTAFNTARPTVNRVAASGDVE